ncbi:UDP-glycosyltransferase 89B2-like [Diospyros lotus]|uniref:UDP-glycosyltransferase 89B2-like n=1 Tax=Diospyros lotus TaxID=55363 RepID=UPI002250AB59|nr:UDP-glycosyltransferase 89B2-like [Diospyros lotus]
MSTSCSGGGGHLLVFPYPAPGHMTPLLHLTHQLASRGFTISILVTPKNLPLLNPLLSKHPSLVHPLVLPFPPHPALPAGVENVKDLPPTAFPALMHSMHQLYTPILHWFRSHSSPPTFIISDMFLWWTQKLADDLSIRRFMFSSSGFMAMDIIYSLRRHPPKGGGPDDPDHLIAISEVPSSPVYPWWQLQFLYSTGSYVEGDPVSEFLKHGVLANNSSWGMIFNSFSGLERVYLEHLKEQVGHDRVWAVGPLLPPVAPLASNIKKSDGLDYTDADDILSWLDKCEDQSVVYVCFGTQSVLNPNQMAAIASGLEESGAKFIWRVKEMNVGMVPQGFEDRVAGSGRGLIAKGWAPQTMILRHRAVGAFLTHCGWNSVLEGIMGGVPMLAWPMEGEQFLNAKLLVEELKVASRVCEGAQTVPDSGELAQLVAKSVGANRDENVKAMHVRAMQLGKAASDSIKEGGGSCQDLDGLAAHILLQDAGEDSN